MGKRREILEAQRHVRVMAHALWEEHECGLITGSEHMKKLAELHRENGNPFDRTDLDPGKIVDRFPHFNPLKKEKA